MTTTLSKLDEKIRKLEREIGRLTEDGRRLGRRVDAIPRQPSINVRTGALAGEGLYGTSVLNVGVGYGLEIDGDNNVAVSISVLHDAVTIGATLSGVISLNAPGTPQQLIANAAITQGDLWVANSTPVMSRLPRGSAYQLLTMNGAGTDPAWTTFDWDNFSGNGGDMAHNHSSAAEGGSLGIGVTDTDAVAGSIFFAGTNGVLQQDNSNLFWDDSSNALGVRAANPAASASGVYAPWITGDALPTVYVGDASSTQTAVYAITDTGTAGVYGQSGSGVGVYGLSEDDDGVYGQTNGGEAVDNGVWGHASDAGRGVYGSAQSGKGVEGSSATGIAGYFNLTGAGTEILRCDDGGTPAFVVDDGGYCGVGISVPQEDLHVYSNVSSDTTLEIENANSGGYSVLKLSSDSNSLLAIAHGSSVATTRLGIAMADWSELYTGNSSGLMIDIVGNFPFVIGTNGSERFRISGGGNVGIRTASEFGSGVGVVGIANAATNPSTTPSNAFVLYSDGGKAKIRESANRFIVQAVMSTVTTIGAPYANAGYVEMVIDGNTIKVMITT